MECNTAKNEVAKIEPGYQMTAEQTDLIKKTVCKGATNDELALFLYTAKRTGLDALAKQIHAVKRGGVMTIQTGIDGYRLIADRTGKYAPGPISVVMNGAKVESATASVKKLVAGVWHDVTATAYYAEYASESSPMWKKMPRLMISKCAEALALRRAFPAELSGLYTVEEMGQADVTVHEATVVEAVIVKPVVTAAVTQVFKTPAVVAKVTPVIVAKVAAKPVVGDASMTFIPKKVTVKDGASARGPWKKFGILTPDGKWIGTFDSVIGEMAVGAQAVGAEVVVDYVIDGNFLNAVRISLATPTQDEVNTIEAETESEIPF